MEMNNIANTVTNHCMFVMLLVISGTPGVITMKKEQIIRRKSFLIINLKCFVEKNIAHKDAIMIEDTFMKNGAFPSPR